MSKTRIYIVEDEALIAMELSDRLTKLGYEICGRAARGEVALAEIPDARPDLVLMDIRLAGALNGIETAAQLRQSRDLPVLFLTAFSDPQSIQQAVGAEPFGYLVKPFDERELHAAIQVAIYKHRMEGHRAHANKLESQLRMAGGIAHEFNNLLQVIVGHLGLIRMELSDGSSMLPSVDEALRAAQAAADITHKLFVFTGKAHVAFKEIDINEVVRKRSAALRAAAGPSNTVSLRMADGIPSVKANEEQVAKILDELVTNSAEAIGAAGLQSGEIVISTGAVECDEAALSQSRLEEKPRPGTFVYLEVADNGSGMDALTLQQAFDPFATTKILGRGLGLPSVHGIVRSHKGGIFVNSSPGQGARIRIIFPIEREAYAPPELGLRQEMPARPADLAKVILVVDDDSAVRFLSQRALERLGYRVMSAGGGVEAVALFRDRGSEIGGVLLDLSMPGMDGIKTFEELRRIRPEVKVLLSSGYYREDIRRQYEEKGFAGFLQKPFQIQTLREELERLLEAK